METVFAVTRPGAKTSSRFAGKFALKPGESANIARSQVDAQLALDVAAGEFTSLPAMARDEAAGRDPLQLAVNALAKGANDRDTDFAFEATPVAGAAGALEVELAVICQDTDHANNPINHAVDGRRIALEITAGSAEFDVVGGGQGPKNFTFKEGRAVAKLVVAAAITEAQTVDMTDPDASGLTVPAGDATVNFNA